MRKRTYSKVTGLVFLAIFISVSSFWLGATRAVKVVDSKETELSQLKKTYQVIEKENESISKHLEELEILMEKDQVRYAQLGKQLEEQIKEKDDELLFKEEQIKEVHKLHFEKIQQLETEIKRLKDEKKIVTETKPPIATPPSKNKKVFLTFDDGPTTLTPQVLDILTEYDVQATFFTIGKRMEASPDLVRKTYQEGHMILPHSYSHDYAIYTTFETFYRDFKKAEEAYENVLGFKPPQIFRFPGGSSNQSSYQYGGKQFMPSLTVDVREKGYTYVDWNVTSGDAGPESYNQAKLLENVVTGSEGKDFIIVLFHDVSTNEATATVLPEVIQYYQKNGFTFRTFRDVTNEELKKMEELKLSNKTISY
jgi:peptidoglycan-N-acetylglucosamine deacetylase